MLPNYPSVSGTVDGEIDNEVYNRYGPEGLLDVNRHKGWHNQGIFSAERFIIGIIQYDLLNLSPTKLLKTEIRFKKYEATTMVLAPSSIHFEWLTANIPFITKEEADKAGLTYPL